MPPFHVRDESDYVLWIEKLVEDNGGWIVGILEYELLEVGLDQYYGVIIRKTPVAFGDGSRLSFTLHVDGELEARKYAFDYRAEDGRLIWRKDMHVGHEDLGSQEHVHRGVEGEANPEKFDHVEFDEVLREIEEYQADGTMP